MGCTFFKHSGDIIGVMTTNNPGEPRSVCLKDEDGLRVTLKEETVDKLWVFWIFPMVEQSEQVWCPYIGADWEHLIAVCERNAPLLPLNQLTWVNY